MTARATPTADVERRSRGVRFAGTLFVSATLLFTCQPMVARMFAPLLGGAPSVWIVCSLCFQAILLGGYCYAHVVGSRLSIRAQVVVHLALVASAFLVLPVAVDEERARALTAHPSLGLLALLLRTIGLPFFVLSTTSPLLQRWFAELGERDPYYLYAASNAGSMLALVGYPLVVDPLLSVRAQSRGLHAGYAVYAAFVVACAVHTVTRRRPLRVEATPLPPGVTSAEGELAAPPSVAGPARASSRLRQRLAWIALAFVPSSLLLGTTEYVTTTVASVPLFWLLPLALYLASFIVAFSKRRVVSNALASRALAVAALLVALAIVFDVTRPAWLVVAGHMALLFFASVACHQALAARRPHVGRLTEFYLLLSFGGVLGGVFNGLVAPQIFDDLLEYPIAIALACLARGVLRAPDDRSRASVARDVAFAAALGLVMIVYAARDPVPGETIVRDRSFFGVLRVVRDPARHVTRLVYGRTLEGEQSTDAAQKRVPLAYYHPSGPAGDVLARAGAARAANDAHGPRRVGVVGLGVGSLAAYAAKGDAWTFFELNPAIVDVARSRFTYLSDAAAVARVDVEIGDARLLLRDGPGARFDVLVLDATSSEAVPVHLLTREALAVYRRALAPGGLLAAHVTNPHVRLAPVLGVLAREAGLVAVERVDDAISAAERAIGKSSSHWVAIAATREDLDRAGAFGEGWTPVAIPPAQKTWTDDYADVLAAMRF